MCGLSAIHYRPICIYTPSIMHLYCSSSADFSAESKASECPAQSNPYGENLAILPNIRRDGYFRCSANHDPAPPTFWFLPKLERSPSRSQATITSTYPNRPTGPQHPFGTVAREGLRPPSPCVGLSTADEEHLIVQGFLGRETRGNQDEIGVGFTERFGSAVDQTAIGRDANIQRLVLAGCIWRSGHGNNGSEITSFCCQTLPAVACQCLVLPGHSHSIINKRISY